MRVVIHRDPPRRRLPAVALPGRHGMARFLRGAALVGVALGGTATAQNSAPERRRDISVGVDARYSSNAVRLSPAVAQLRGVEASDFVVSPTIDVDILQPLGAQQLSLSGSLAYDIYGRNTQYNRERINLDAGAALRAGPCAVNLAAGVSRQRSDLVNQYFLAGSPNIVFDPKNTQTVQRYGATASCGRAIGLRPTLEVSREIGNNSSLQRRFVDYRTWSYGGGLTYTQPSIGTVYAYARRSETKYPRQLTALQREGFKSDNIGINFERRITPRLQGRVGIGAMRVTSADPSVPRYTGLTYNAGLSAQIGQRLSADLNASRTARPPLFSDAAYIIQDDISLGLNYSLSPRLSINGGGSVARTDYRYPTAAGFVGDPSGTSKSAFIGLGYKVNPRLRLGASAGIDERSSPNPSLAYTNKYVGVSARYTLGMGGR